jgi:hypothetical protein
MVLFLTAEPLRIDGRCLADNHLEAIMHKEGGHIVETPVEARAGFLDRPVLVVLMVSVILVVGAFALVAGGFFS